MRKHSNDVIPSSPCIPPPQAKMTVSSSSSQSILCSLKSLVFVVSQFDLLLFSMAFSPSFFVSLSLALCGLFGVGQCALKVVMIHPIMIYIFKILIDPFSSKVGLVCWIRYFECLWNMQCPLSIRRRLYSTTSSSLSSSGRHQSERFFATWFLTPTGCCRNHCHIRPCHWDLQCLKQEWNQLSLVFSPYRQLILIEFCFVSLTYSPTLGCTPIAMLAQYFPTYFVQVAFIALLFGYLIIQ